MFVISDVLVPPSKQILAHRFQYTDRNSSKAIRGSNIKMGTSKSSGVIDTIGVALRLLATITMVIVHLPYLAALIHSQTCTSDILSTICRSVVAFDHKRTFSTPYDMIFYATPHESQLKYSSI